MEVSNEIKEEIRKTQADLKNAIRVHQVWVARLQEDENNQLLKFKVKEAEKEIIVIGQSQKLVVDRLRRELELYQQRLKLRNKPVNIESDNRYVAQQLRDHQNQYRNKTKGVSLLKPSVLSEIHIKTENGDLKQASDSENDSKFEGKENGNYHEDEREKYSYGQHNAMQDGRTNFTNALNKVKESFISSSKVQNTSDTWRNVPARSESDSSNAEPTPSPSPPPIPDTGEPISQETFLRLVGLVTPEQKEVLEKKRNERRKRATTSTNRNEFVYDNFDMQPKRKKYNNFPYLQSHTGPPQTRSRRQQRLRESSPETEREREKGWNKPAWAASLPASLTVEPIFTPSQKSCHACGRSDVPSLLVWCSGCEIHLHTGCGESGRCPTCNTPLPPPPPPPPPANNANLFRDRLAERKRLQERNVELCDELRKLETRADMLKKNLDKHSAEKRELLAAQIKTQRQLQTLLDFVGQFKETSVSVRSTSASRSGSESEFSKSNED